MRPEVVEKLVAAIERRDADALADVFADDAVLHHPLARESIEGKGAIVASEQALFDAFSEIEVEVVRVIGKANEVAIEVVVCATNTGALDVGGEEALPATGRRIELPSVWLLRLDSDGKIAEERDYLDTASLFRQLGLAGDS
jgi:steroid delta-isomerase-like uncharacterized protein